MINTMGAWASFADAVAVFHVAYVAFVAFGLAAIVIGAAWGTRWVRNFRFRALHLAAMGFVLLETLIGIMCPLTVLEDRLRHRAGQTGYPADFLGYWVDRLIFYHWPPWVFATLYVSFTLAIVVVMIVVPPELPWRRNVRR